MAAKFELWTTSNPIDATKKCRTMVGTYATLAEAQREMRVQGPAYLVEIWSNGQLVDSAWFCP